MKSILVAGLVCISLCGVASAGPISVNVMKDSKKHLLHKLTKIHETMKNQGREGELSQEFWEVYEGLKNGNAVYEKAVLSEALNAQNLIK